MVEGARLESVYTGNRIAGSNPAPSATKPLRTPPSTVRDAKIPRVSVGFQVPSEPLRLPRAHRSVSKALPSHSDRTWVPLVRAEFPDSFQGVKTPA